MSELCICGVWFFVIVLEKQVHAKKYYFMTKISIGLFSTTFKMVPEDIKSANCMSKVVILKKGVQKSPNLIVLSLCNFLLLVSFFPLRGKKVI